MPDDLKNYTAQYEADPFQLIAPDAAIFILICFAFAAFVFERWL